MRSFYFIIILSILLIGCSFHGTDERLQAVFELFDSNPRRVAMLLDSIDYSDLSSIDRHYYHFILAKTRDKAGISHTSAVGIRNAIAHFSRHNRALYPEALYYGSRVSSSLGDYTSAIDYARLALEKTPEGNHTLRHAIELELESVLTPDHYSEWENRRERLNEKSHYEHWLVTLLFICYFLCSVVLFLKLQNRTKIIELREALANIRLIKDSIENPQKDITLSVGKEPNINLRDELRQQLLDIYNTSGNRSVDPRIIQSEAYTEIQNHILNGAVIKENSELWGSVEETVLSVSPNFKTHLQLLTGGKLTRQELHTAYLIKCGITPTQMASLLGRTKGSISSRREMLCLKVFDEKLGAKVIDGIIRCI